MAVSFFVAAVVLFFALTLSYSLRGCGLVLSASAQRYWPRQTPPKDAGSPTGDFLSAGGKKVTLRSKGHGF